MIQHNPTTFPLKSPKTAEGKRAAELHAEWISQHERVNALERERSASVRAVDDAERDLRSVLLKIETTGKSDPTTVDAKVAAIEAAKASAAQPWAEKIDAAKTVALRKHGAFQGYVDEHLEAILAEPEIQAAGKAAVDDFAASLEATQQAYMGLHAVRNRLEFFVNLAASVSGQDVPSFGVLDPFRSALGRAQALVEDGRVQAPAIDSYALEVRQSIRSTGELPQGRKWGGGGL